MDDALDVHVNHLGKLSGGDSPEGGVPVDECGVVEDDVGSHAGREDTLGPLGNGGLVAYIHLFEFIGRGVLLGEMVDGRFGSAASVNGVALTDEFLRHRFPQSLGRACNDDLLAHLSVVLIGLPGARRDRILPAPFGVA